MTRNSYLSLKEYLFMLCSELLNVRMFSSEVREQADAQLSASALVLMQVSVE